MYYEQDVREKLRVLHWAPIVYSTAVAGHSVEKYALALPHLSFLNEISCFVALLNMNCIIHALNAESFLLPVLLRRKGQEG